MTEFPLITIDGETWECCPECYNDDPAQEIPLNKILNNSGFDEMPHWDVVGMKCPECGTQYQI